MMGCEHIRNIALLDGARVGVVYDPVSALAEAAAQLADGAVCTASLEALVRHKDLDAIIIASPNYLHVDQIYEIARLRTLPILCEKPLCTTQDDFARIEALQTDYAAPIWVAMEYRYMPPISRLISEAEEVTGGISMLSIREHRYPFLEKIGDWNRFNRNTGGTLVEKCCHFFDLMRLILKSDPVRVVASAGQAVNHMDETYKDEVPDIWDNGYVIFEFETGARAMLDLCMFAEGTLWNEEISAVGANGKIECRLPGPQRFWPTDRLGPSPQPEISYYPRMLKAPRTEQVILDEALLAAGDHHGSTFFQHERFLEVVCGQAEPEVTLHDGLKAVQMGIAAQTAAVEKRSVDL